MEHGRKTKIPEDPQHQQQPRGLKGRPGAGAAGGDEVSGRQKARKAAAAGRTPREGRRDGARGPCTEGRGGRPTPTELAFRDTGLRGAADQAFLGPDPEGSRTTPNGTGTSTAHAVLSAEDGPGRPQRRGRGWPSARRTLPASRVGSGGMKSPSGRVGAPTAGQPHRTGRPVSPLGTGALPRYYKPWNGHPRGRRRRDLPEPIPEGTRPPGAGQGESSRAGGPAERRADAPGRATRGGRDARGAAWLQGAFPEDGPDRPRKPHRGSSTGRASRRPARTRARPTDAGEAGAVPGPGRDTRGNRDRAARHTSRPRTTTEQPPWRQQEAPATPGTAPAASR